MRISLNKLEAVYTSVQEEQSHFFLGFTEYHSRYDQLTAEDFQSQYHPASVATDAVADAKGLTLEELEKRTILQALDTHDNNLTQVALSLGISRAALYRRLEKYGISFND